MKALTPKALTLAGAAALLLSTITLDAALADGHLRFARENRAGGVTAGKFGHHTGPNGGEIARGHGLATDGEGNAVGGSGACARGAQGEACRAGAFTRDAQGNVTRQGGAAFEGANGASGTTEGGFTKNADGTYSGARDTELSGANGSYSGSTTYSSENGVSHSATCMDTAGNVVACPTR